MNSLKMSLFLMCIWSFTYLLLFIYLFIYISQTFENVFNWFFLEFYVAYTVYANSPTLSVLDFIKISYIFINNCYLFLQTFNCETGETKKRWWHMLVTKQWKKRLNSKTTIITTSIFLFYFLYLFLCLGWSFITLLEKLYTSSNHNSTTTVSEKKKKNYSFSGAHFRRVKCLASRPYDFGPHWESHRIDAFLVN